MNYYTLKNSKLRVKNRQFEICGIFMAQQLENIRIAV